MAEVRVTNTRRSAFTALAIVAFGVVTYRRYWSACEFEYETHFFFSTSAVVSPLNPLFIAALITLFPLAFLVASGRRPQDAVSNPWILASVFLIWSTVLAVEDSGHEDASRCLATNHGSNPLPWGERDARGVFRINSGERERDWARMHHQVDWLWLALPFILTSAIVIYGAKRAAIRGLDEDE